MGDAMEVTGPVPAGPVEDRVESDEWAELAAAAAEPNPFFESWFLAPALAQFDPTGAVEVFRHRADGRLAGLMPLVRAARYEGRPLPHLRNWMHANAFLGTPLVRPGHEEGFWQALLAHADAAAGRPLFLHLEALALDGPCFAALEAVCARQGRRLGVVARWERAVLASRVGAERYRRDIVPAKRRKDLARLRRLLDREGEVRIRELARAEDIDRWIANFLRIEQAGWKGRAGSALACDPRTLHLFAEALAVGARRDALIRSELLLDGQPIAMLVNFRQGRASFGFKTCYDERHARFSPGVLLEYAYLDMLDRPDIAWCDSCAAPDHPVMNALWTARREIGRVSIAVGGPSRRALFAALLRFENRRGRP